jgi:glutathione S-transferase
VVVQQWGDLSAFHTGEAWAEQRRPQLEARVRLRLGELAEALGDKPYLEGRFTAGDLMMSTVLRILTGSDLLDSQPAIKAYHARCEARPAFQRALAAQLATFKVNAPAA